MTGEPAVAGVVSARQPTILVVDDTPANLALMSKLLRENYRVRIANSGEKALRIAASGSPPDLILLDIMMPGMDGYEVCRRLKRDPGTADIPVIFLTAKAEAGDEEKGLGLGAVDYITKPISPPIVMARVKNHLALKAMANFLREKNLELQEARSVADKANFAKSDFLSGMSHELRTPLNAILGFAQLLSSESPPPSASQVESIDQILRAGWYLLKLINEILDLAQIESGKLALSLEPVLLADAMEECQAMIEPQAGQRRITMRFPEFSAPTYVRADATRLKQVLINLLSNAIKYNRPEGTVIVDCTGSTPERIRVSVKDAGAGLPADMLQQLFQPFNRLGQEGGAEEGTGIGLVMSKRVVELMGGVIGVQSTVGVGSVFWFELPSASAPELAAAAAAPAPAAQADFQRDGPARTLLYIEDNPANLKLVERLIARRPDLRLLSAVTGTLGIETARSRQPALILMDINLPGMSGLEALRILRGDPATAHIPVVAVSANAMPRDMEKGLAAGFFRYLTKPIKVDQFMETLNLALERTQHEVVRSK